LQRYGEPATGASSPETDRAALRTVRLLAVAVFVIVIAVVLRLTVLSLDSPGASSRAATPAKASTSTVDDLGPQAGVDIAAYAQARRTALAGATGERVSVASLASYATEAQARALVGSLPVVAFLVAPPEGPPSTVSGSLFSWANGQVSKLRDERDEIRKLLPTVTDPVFQEFYGAEIDRLDRAAKALGPSAPIVFAVVVKGPTAGLQALGARPEIRLLDVGSGAQPGQKATYRGLRPEERIKANDPSTRPA